MNKIIRKEQFSENVFLFEIEAPLIARSRKAGNFIIVRVGEKGERVPLTIADADTDKGTITIVVQRVGLSSVKLCRLNAGDCITDVVGPLGNPTHIEKFGTVICAGGGVGVAPMLPIIKALKAAGNRVLSVLAGRTKDLIILEDEVRKNSDQTIIMTDDGSYGEKGVVTVGIEKLINQEHIDKVFAIGPPVMMKFCCLLTQKYNIPTDVSLNTIMVDGTGMCGACRLTIGGKTKFVCIDGPEFDGALVDWDEMFKRMGTFKRAEKEEMEHFEEHIDAVSAGSSRKAVATTADEPQGSDTIETLTDRNAQWRQELRKSMKPKERTAIERVAMPELDPAYRATTRTEEVNIGLTREMAVREAKRCLDCAKPTCVEGCPVGIDIPSFVKNIERGHILDAAKVLKHTSSLPAVCGRVCPQEKQCESRCIHLKMNEPAVAIGYLERFAADYERESGKAVLPEMAPSNGMKVAVVGSGPAGLSFAGDMAKKGYDVYVFEALHEIGGVLKYGIPEFRLPNRIVDVEIDNLRRMGVQTVMITGDNRLTAAAIASEAGVDDFIAESTPESKLAAIRAFQKAGHLVAMTGDGANDAPALAQADVALAMHGGTQAAKEAANMVDLDSNPTKLMEVIRTGKEMMITRGALTTFSLMNDLAKYVVVVPAVLSTTDPVLASWNILGLASPESALLSAVIFNALVIPLLMPFALKGVEPRAVGASELLTRNLLVWGLSGIAAPIVGIALIDQLLRLTGFF